MKFWDLVLRINFHGAPRLSWERLGEHYPLFEPLLETTGRLAGHIGCDKCGCNHRVFPGDTDGEVRAVCQCDESTCDDLVLNKKSVELLAVAEKKLPSLLGDCLPMTPRLFAPFIPGIQTWRLGLVHLLQDMREASLVVCFSVKDLDLCNAALGCSNNDFGPTILVCRTTNHDEVEVRLPPDSMTLDFEDLWELKDGCFVPGKSARRILAGWDDEIGGLASNVRYPKGHSEPSNSDLSKQIAEGLDQLRSELIQDFTKTQTQETMLAEVAGEADEFLSKMLMRLNEDECSLFMALRGKVPDGATERHLTYKEIGKKLKGISKQAVSARVKKLKEQHPQVWRFLDSVRKTKPAKNFSEMSPKDRRKHGVDGSYDHEADD